jgi:subtilisin family serine protease
VRTLLRHPGPYLIVHWLVTLSLAAALLLPVEAPRAPGGRSPASITLLTGQTVSVNAGGVPMVEQGIDEGHQFSADWYAVPTGVTGAIGSGLDPALFDTTYLEANGFDNNATSRLPVLVSFRDHAAAAAAVQAGRVDGIVFTHLFQDVPWAVGYVSKSGPFYQPGVVAAIREVSLDAIVQATPEQVTPQLHDALPLMNVEAARARGLTGKGVTVAVVDTGIDSNHPDLEGRVVASANFSPDNTVEDLNGHGTHVAGIVAGTGAASDGKYGGVAPQALLVNAKALGQGGNGSLSGVAQAMEWAAGSGARVINMSLGAPATDGTDLLSQLVNTLSASKNVLFVIAAGNSGPGAETVGTPGAADSALTVGAMTKSKTMAYFSSRGPRRGNAALKPDIIAPGVDITAPRAGGRSGDAAYISHSGTSMASPMIAGAAALVLQLHPGWSAKQVKAALMTTAVPITTDGTDEGSLESAFNQGAGLASLAGIVNQQVLVDPASQSYGRMARGVSKQLPLVLQNLSNKALRISLKAVAYGTQGSEPTWLRLSLTEFTLPSEQQYSLVVTVTAPSARGTYSGEVAVLDRSTNTILAHLTVGFVTQ